MVLRERRTYVIGEVTRGFEDLKAPLFRKGKVVVDSLNVVAVV